MAIPASQAPFPSVTKTWHTESYAAIDPTRLELSAKGKVIVITGGAGAIGAAIAIGFARAGASAIVLTGRTEKTLKATSASINEAAPAANIQYHVADITDEEGFTSAMNDVKKSYGPIDVFVNNAGYLSNGNIADSDYLSEWWKHMEVHVLGSLIAFRAFLPNAAKDAVILNNTSGIGIFPPMLGKSAYQVSKLANSKLFEDIQAEHPQFHVVNIQPGVVESDLNGKSDIPGMDNVNLPGDFAVWAASPEARFLNGKYVFVNWDVEELVAMKEELAEPTYLRLGLEGWTAKGWNPSGLVNEKM